MLFLGAASQAPMKVSLRLSCGLLLGAALLAGCKKDAPSPAAGGTAPATGAPQAAALPPNPHFQSIKPDATAEEVAGLLTTELRRYLAYKRVLPKNFEEFMTNDPITYPPPPAGKKYVILGGRVVLANK